MNNTVKVTAWAKYQVQSISIPNIDFHIQFFVIPCVYFVDRITIRTSFGLFILGYFINIDYGHIASDKGASICERSVLSFDIRVLFLHRKRTFHSAI